MTGEPDEQIATLWHTLRASGDRDVRDELIARYGGFARAIAAKLYATRPDDSTPFEDYLQYARVGLIESLDRYLVEHGASFETFSSYRIRGAILNGLSRETELRAQRSHWRERVADRSASLLGERSERPERASLEDFVQLAVGLAVGLILEDATAAAVDESAEANPYAATELAQLRARVSRLVDQLPDREREVVQRHYYQQHEFQQIAADLQISKGRVSQLHARAVERIRAALETSPRIDRNL
jgi:RNA polymerase sigma factor for flagellar operon FliA